MHGGLVSMQCVIRRMTLGTPVVLNCLNALAALIILSGSGTAQSTSQIITADVVVYGGTSAGVIAAVQTAKMGRTAVLVSPTLHLGGMSSSGLGFTDTGNKQVIGGLARDFYRRIQRHYLQREAWRQEASEEYSRFHQHADAMWVFEPHVAEQVFEELLAENDIVVMREERLQRPGGAVVGDDRIHEIVLESGVMIRGSQFIDATYEGDLMAAAGVRYVTGRESNEVWGETLNGNQPLQNTHNHRFVTSVDPWVIPGDSSSGLLDGIDAGGRGIEGAGDQRIQAYCFRLCMTRDETNRRPFEKPDSYREEDYELLFRTLESGDLRLPFSPALLPNRKTDTNNNHAVSTDFIGQNYDYPEASWEQRELIIQRHRSWQEGLMWTLSYHPRVPKSIRREMQQWGLAADEFEENSNWPRELYIRESRRMVSDYVMTEMDCRRVRLVEDAVGLGSYNMDSHNVRRFVNDDGFVQNEGDVQVSPGGAYLISYRSIIPARGQASNLSVPVCLSASHIAYGSIRMEPVFMILGQSAATAAVLCLEDEVALQDLPWQKLQSRLLQDGQVLDLPAGSQAREMIRPEDLAGVVLDETAAELRGAWTPSSSNPGFVGGLYLHDGNTEKGQKQAVWEYQAAESGSWEISLSWTAHQNRAKHARVSVQCGGVTVSAEVDQTLEPMEQSLFQPVAVIRAEKGEMIRVTLSNVATSGYVIADAVRFQRLLARPADPDD